jgi:GNAT superfamily N-acetyltransferase
VIRRARSDESDGIAELYERPYATLTFLPRLHTLEKYKAFMARHVVDDDVWVWDENGAVVGFMILRGKDDLFLMYLEFSANGRGIGTALLEHAKRERPNGFTLRTFQQNDGARRFYERHGLRAIAFGDGSGNEEAFPTCSTSGRLTDAPGMSLAKEARPRAAGQYAGTAKARGRCILPPAASALGGGRLRRPVAERAQVRQRPRISRAMTSRWISLVPS